MKFALPALCSPANPVEDAFERLRQAFNARLCGDRTRLIALGSDLDCRTIDPASVLDEIQMFAHRLRGAAAVFENALIGRVAKALEVAAMAASVGNSPRCNSSVRSAITTMVEHLPVATAALVAPSGGRELEVE